ncbi:MAG: T9SS type A sorting domain-containing protein [Ignavibacteria bacterium]
MKKFTKLFVTLLCVFLISVFSLSSSQSIYAATIQNATFDGEPFDLDCGGDMNFQATTNLQWDVVSTNALAVSMNVLSGPPSGSTFTFVSVAPLTYHFSWPSVPFVFPMTFIRFEIRDALGTILEVCDVTYEFPLPVELASFASIVSRNDVKLNWTTTSEINNARFEIERSTVSQDWSKVGTVEGNGTITNPTSYSFTDRGLASGSYSYRLKQVDFNGNFEYFNLNNEVAIGAPSGFELSQNYPNPFNPSTNIEFGLPEAGNVSIKVYDINGKLVSTISNGFMNAGFYTVRFDAFNLASGIYFYKFDATNFTKIMKMSLVK